MKKFIILACAFSTLVISCNNSEKTRRASKLTSFDCNKLYKDKAYKDLSNLKEFKLSDDDLEKVKAIYSTNKTLYSYSEYQEEINFKLNRYLQEANNFNKSFDTCKPDNVVLPAKENFRLLQEEFGSKVLKDHKEFNRIISSLYYKFRKTQETCTNKIANTYFEALKSYFKAVRRHTELIMYDIDLSKEGKEKVEKINNVTYCALKEDFYVFIEDQERSINPFINQKIIKQYPKINHSKVLLNGDELFALLEYQRELKSKK